MNVIVTGSLGYDYIMDFPGRFADRIMPDKIHQISLSFLVDKLDKQFGGTAGNIAYTLKLLGIEPTIFSCAGNDFAEYAAHLDHFDISKQFIKRYSNVATGAYFVVTDQEDNQIGAFYMGATKNAKELSIIRLLQQHIQEDLLHRASFIVISPTDPVAMTRYVRDCQALKISYMYDPAFQIDHFTTIELRQGITRSTILIGNDYEIALIEKKLGISHADLLQLTPIVVTTLGSKGSVIESRIKNKESKVDIKPALPKNTSDPTGAGDAYRAGFLAGYLRNFDLKMCGQMGSVAAVYTVEKYGTQTHTFSKREFIERFAENYGGTITL